MDMEETGDASFVEVWECSDGEDEDINEPNRGTVPVQEMTPASLILLKFMVIFLLSWQAIFRVSNVAMDLAFKFMGILLHKLSDLVQSNKLRLLAEAFPTTMLKAHAYQGINRAKYQVLIVCRKCHSTYDSDTCLKTSVDKRSTATCSFVRFPRHPHARLRAPCGTALMKTVKTSSHRTVYKPIKVFCYSSLINAIQEYVSLKGYLNIFSHWKARVGIPDGVMADIYDGAVWKSFQTVNGQEFLSSRYSLGLLLNVDWFNPYKHVAYSVGAIYICILNFPRHLRYQKENMILIGIIPGPNEPSLHINSFIEPLVVDLQKLWKGVQMTTPDGVKTIRAALLCTAADIPATRKLCGFVGHGALKGCSRCLKSFPTTEFGAKPDYSGFQRNTWPMRHLSDHREQGMNWKHATTLKKRQDIEREYGIRFSELLNLPYYDTIRFSVVDPMHNVLLGSAKNIMMLWKENGIIGDTHLTSVQDLVDKFVTPADVGRIPTKISSGFASFTADQWKNWTVIFSQVALKTILPDDHYRCWHSFVMACHIMCSRAISKAGISEMDRYMMSFCTMFQELFGPGSCTPNLHLHGHIQECYLDYGPADAFWLFAFERLNGILGSVPTNHQAIEVQLMKKFLTTQQVLQQMKSGIVDEDLKDMLTSSNIVKGSLKHEQLSELPLMDPLSQSNADKLSKLCKLIPPIREACLPHDDVSQINLNMKACFGGSFGKTLILHKYSSSILFGTELYGSLNSLHANSSLVYVGGRYHRPGFVTKYLRLTVLLSSNSEPSKSKTVTIFVAAVNWLDEHPYKDWFGAPVEVWQKVSHHSVPHTFVPVADIVCRCAFVSNKVKFNEELEEDITAVVPINHFSGLI